MQVHETDITVRYGETDAMGIAHHSSYLGWFEVGRVELMRAIGFPYAELEKAGTAFPVIEARLRYLQPARFDETLRIGTTVMSLTRTRMQLGYTIEREGSLVAFGYTVHAALGPAGKPMALDEAFREALAPFLADDDTVERLKWAIRD